MSIIHNVKAGGALLSRRELLGRTTKALTGAILALALNSGPVFAQETGTGGADVGKIKELLGIEGDNLGGDLEFKLGAVLALTGPGSFYGKFQGNGARLAAAQIKAMGGPDIELIFKDHKSADAQAGARAARELGIDRVPAALTSYVGVIGSMFPGIEQYKILSFDGGGGTSNFGQDKPYFYGMRAIEPDDAFIGAMRYWKETNPDIKKVSIVYIDQGPINSIVENNFKAALAENGQEFASAEATPIGATDYTATITRLRTTAPDAVFLFLIGVDPGYFMKQYVNAGLEMPVMGAEYVPDAAEIAGDAFNDYMFSLDWFYAKEPANEWSQIFIDSYEAEFGDSPEINAANYYEDTFAVWQLIREVLAAGGDPNNSEDLLKALEANPNFASVYGGEGDAVGTLSIDTQGDHSVTQRPLGVFKYNGGDPVRVATFELGGKNFQLTE